PNVPDNRLFEYRQPIVGMSGSVLGYNNGANTQEGEPDHASGLNDVSADHSVWWTWQAPDTERMLFSATSSKIDSVVNVYRGTDLNALTPVPAERLSADELWFVAEAGETYHLALAGRDGAQGDLALTWDSAEPAAAPLVINGDNGQPAIICELPECDMDASGN